MQLTEVLSYQMIGVDLRFLIIMRKSGLCDYPVCKYPDLFVSAQSINKLYQHNASVYYVPS